MFQDLIERHINSYIKDKDNDVFRLQEQHRSFLKEVEERKYQEQYSEELSDSIAKTLEKSLIKIFK